MASLVAYAWIMGFIGVKTNTAGQAILIQSDASGINEHELIVYVQNVAQGSFTILQSGGIYIDDVGYEIDSDVAVSEGQTETLR